MSSARDKYYGSCTSGGQEPLPRGLSMEPKLSVPAMRDPSIFRTGIAGKRGRRRGGIGGINGFIDEVRAGLEKCRAMAGAGENWSGSVALARH